MERTVDWESEASGIIPELVLRIDFVSLSLLFSQNMTV